MVDRTPKLRTATDAFVVLVVEDEVLIRLDTAEELRRAGSTVLEASSAEEALNLLSSGHCVDAIFSDYQLLGPLNGYDLYRAVSVEYPDIVFILTSAQMMMQHLADEGIAFTPKPYQPHAVVEAITRAVANRETDNDG